MRPRLALATWIMECAMPDEVAADHSGILVPPTYKEVSSLLLELGLEMPAANVKWLGDLLVSSRRNEASRPSRSDLTDRITKLRDAAREISDALALPPILSWLAEARPDLIEKWPDHWAATQDLIQAAEAAWRLVPKGRGRARSTTRREISPRATCAVFVNEMFGLAGRKRPAATNTRAHAIAEALWLASGGPPWTRHAKDPASWRRYFVEATEASPGYRQVLREFVRKRLLSTELSVKRPYSALYVPEWQWEYRCAT